MSRLHHCLVQQIRKRISFLGCEICKVPQQSSPNFFKQSFSLSTISFSSLKYEVMKENKDNIGKPKGNMNRKPKTLSIEGNIGCGKSTMLEIFGKRLDVEAVPEQVEKWTNWNGVNMLQAMYDNPTKYGVEFQNIVIKTMVENHLKKTTKKLKLMERSLFSTEQCFIKNSYEDRVFTESQFDTLTKKCKGLREDLNISVDCFIYMRISPETALYRIKERGRAGEENISLELLQKLHFLHEEYINKLTFPVVIVDANKSLNEVISQFNIIFKSL